MAIARSATTLPNRGRSTVTSPIAVGLFVKSTMRLLDSLPLTSFCPAREAARARGMFLTATCKRRGLFSKRLPVAVDSPKFTVKSMGRNALSSRAAMRSRFPRKSTFKP